MTDTEKVNLILFLLLAGFSGLFATMIFNNRYFVFIVAGIFVYAVYFIFSFLKDNNFFRR
jgi:hypothetical protein